MSSRSFCMERVRIQIEIVLEAIGDFVMNSADKLRRPLLVLAGVALVMTLRSARKGVRSMKPGLTSIAHDFSNYRPSASSLTSGLDSGAQFGGGDTASSGGLYGYGDASSYGDSNSYTGMSSGGLRSTPSSTGPSRSTAGLVDVHGATARVLDAAAFKDFGGLVNFYGRVETLSAIEGADVVDKVLQSPGEGRILVVDGGGATKSAIFDATAAQNAQQNGWKGVIIHGVVRNTQELSNIMIGVKALGASPAKGSATSGSKGGIVSIGGMNLSPGDLVYCDKDGIIVSDQELGTESSQPASTSFGTAGSASTSTMGSMGMPGNTMGGTSTASASMGGHQSGEYNTGMAASQQANVMGGPGGMGMSGTTSYGGAAPMPGYGSASGYGSTPGYEASSGYGSAGFDSYPGAGGGGYDPYESYPYSSVTRRYRGGWFSVIFLGALPLAHICAACL